MEEMANKIFGFTPSMLWSALAVIIAVGIIAKLVMDLIIKYRELRKPKVKDEKTIQDKLASDNQRLNKLEETAEKQDKELKLILRSQMAIIHHMVENMDDGEDSTGLKETQKDIETYLITGKIKED